MDALRQVATGFLQAEGVGQGGGRLEVVFAVDVAVRADGGIVDRPQGIGRIDNRVADPRADDLGPAVVDGQSDAQAVELSGREAIVGREIATELQAATRFTHFLVPAEDGRDDGVGHGVPPVHRRLDLVHVDLCRIVERGVDDGIVTGVDNHAGIGQGLAKERIDALEVSRHVRIGVLFHGLGFAGIEDQAPVAREVGRHLEFIALRFARGGRRDVDRPGADTANVATAGAQVTDHRGGGDGIVGARPAVTDVEADAFLIGGEPACAHREAAAGEGHADAGVIRLGGGAGILLAFRSLRGGTDVERRAVVGVDAEPGLDVVNEAVGPGVRGLLVLGRVRVVAEAIVDILGLTDLDVVGLQNGWPEDRGRFRSDDFPRGVLREVLEIPVVGRGCGLREEVEAIPAGRHATREEEECLLELGGVAAERADEDQLVLEEIEVGRDLAEVVVPARVGVGGLAHRVERHRRLEVEVDARDRVDRPHA